MLLKLLKISNFYLTNKHASTVTYQYIYISKSLNEHVIPCLIELHWLPISFRINYKIAVITFKCLHGLAPTYFSELIEEYHPTRTLRSSSQKLLKKKVVKFEKLGKKSFSFSAPEVWNSFRPRVCKILKYVFFLLLRPLAAHFRQCLSAFCSTGTDGRSWFVAFGHALSPSRLTAFGRAV